MGAFCVYGISRGVCKAAASKKQPFGEGEGANRRNYSPAEWGGKRDALAEKMFKDATRRVKVSPELDTPQFCADWLAISPGEVREAVIMVRGPKVDKNGTVVKRGGAVVETWLEYAAECARRNITAAT